MMHMHGSYQGWTKEEGELSEELHFSYEGAE
jgi:hypothetical protein